MGAAAVGALDHGAAVRGGHGVVDVGAVAQEQPARACVDVGVHASACARVAVYVHLNPEAFLRHITPHPIAHTNSAKQLP